MNITISRLRVNRLYTEGELRINGSKAAFTVEPTELMLPAGQYEVRIVKRSARKQDICIFHPNSKFASWKIGLAHSWIDARKTRTIAIGTPLMPGALFKATAIHERITDRLQKCRHRHEPIHLTITEHCCRENKPISHWCRLQVNS